MKKNPSVAVIVLNWNGFEDTVACLQSLRETSYDNSRIVVVDNGSDGREGVRIQELFPDVHLIRNPTNRGFAGGNNDAICWAKQQSFDYIVNLNNDCIVNRDWLEELVAGIQASGADFASSQIMYYPETHLVCSDENVLLPDGSGWVVNHSQTVDGMRAIRTIFAASGAASIYSLRSLAAVEISGEQVFDELYFAYLEDLDLGIRLNACGFKGVCVPDAVVYHKESRTSGYRSFFQLFHLEKNRILNELLNYPLWLIPAGEVYYCLRTLLGLLRRSCRRQEDSKWTKRTAARESRLEIAIRSRLWIISNAPAIWRDRRDRQARRLLSRKIHRFFVWKPFPC